MSDKIYWAIAGIGYILAITIVDDMLPETLAWWWQLLTLAGVLSTSLIVGCALYEIYAMVKVRRLVRQLRHLGKKARDEADRLSPGSTN